MFRFRPEQDLDAVSPQDVRQGRANLFVLTWKELTSPLDDCDLASEAAEELRELDTDVPPTQYDEVRWNGIEFHHGRRIKP